MRPRYILPGFALLLCSAFFDSLRGPLLPIFSHQLNLPYESVSLFLVVGYLSVMIFGRGLIPLVEHFTLRPVAAALTLLTPIAAIYSFQVSNLATLLVFGVLVACASALIGSCSNLFVLKGTDAAYRARFFGLLHAMYGLGSQLAPLALGMVLAAGGPWRSLFVVGSLPVVLLGGWIYFGIPKEKKVIHTDETRPRRFRWRSIQGLLVVAFAIYVAAEVSASMWMTAYIVEVHKLSVAEATPYATGFFVIMMILRLSCYFVRSDRTEARLIVGGLFAGLTALIIGLSGWWMALPLVGFVGPYFPLVLARMSRHLHREAQQLTIRILIISQGATALSHFGVGYLATHYGVAVAYRVPAVLMGLSIVTILAYLRAERRLDVRR